MHAQILSNAFKNHHSAIHLFFTGAVWKEMLNRENQYDEHFVNREQEEERQLVWEKTAGSDKKTLECKVTSGRSGKFLRRIHPIFIIVVCMRLCIQENEVSLHIRPLLGDTIPLKQTTKQQEESHQTNNDTLAYKQSDVGVCGPYYSQWAIKKTTILHFCQVHMPYSQTTCIQIFFVLFCFI